MPNSHQREKYCILCHSYKQRLNTPAIETSKFQRFLLYGHRLLWYHFWVTLLGSAAPFLGQLAVVTNCLQSQQRKRGRHFITTGSCSRNRVTKPRSFSCDFLCCAQIFNIYGSFAAHQLKITVLSKHFTTNPTAIGQGAQAARFNLQK